MIDIEQIRDLELEAIAYADSKVPEDNRYNDIYHSIVRRKLAELIVKECAHLVGGYTKENEFGTDVKEAYEEITKHFGVEE